MCPTLLSEVSCTVIGNVGESSVTLGVCVFHFVLSGYTVLGVYVDSSATEGDFEVGSDRSGDLESNSCSTTKNGWTAKEMSVRELFGLAFLLLWFPCRFLCRIGVIGILRLFFTLGVVVLWVILCLRRVV